MADSKLPVRITTRCFIREPFWSSEISSVSTARPILPHSNNINPRTNFNKRGCMIYSAESVPIFKTIWCCINPECQGNVKYVQYVYQHQVFHLRGWQKTMFILADPPILAHFIFLCCRRENVDGEGGQEGGDAGVKRKGREKNGAKLCIVDQKRSTLRMDVSLCSTKQVQREWNQVSGAPGFIPVNELFISVCLINK